MTQPQGLFLSGVAYRRNIGHSPDLPEKVVLAALLQHLFEFERDVKMVFDRGLVTARDYQDRPNTTRNGFLDRILDKRLIDQR